MCKRPFSSLQDMDDELLSHWRKLSPGDTFYILGDISMGKTRTVRALDAIPEGIETHVIFGNHDIAARELIEQHPKVSLARDIEVVKIQGTTITLCHYAMRAWLRSYDGAWQLFGHSHNAIRPWTNQLDVGVDSAAELLGEYRPFSFGEVAHFIAESQDPEMMAKKHGGLSPSWAGKV